VTVAPDRDKFSRFLHQQVLPRLQMADVYAGIDFKRAGSQWRAPCPLHGGRSRNFVVSDETLEWSCHSQCQAGGDAVSFVEQHEQLTFAAAVLALADRAGVDTTDLTKAKSGAQKRQTVPKPFVRPVNPPQAAPSFPATSEVESVWRGARRVDDDDEVRRWLQDARKIDPVRVADVDLARALSGDAVVPLWAGYGGEDGKPWRSWPSAGLRVVVPLFDVAGVMRSLLFRRPFETTESWPPKSVSARGGRSGLAMACGLGLQLLRERKRPSWWLADRELRVVVAEGEPDFLTIATEWSEADEHAPAVVGGFAGSWSVLNAIPSSTVLVVRTDANVTGAKYATEIMRTVHERWTKRELAIDLPHYFNFEPTTGVTLR
jgi:hypothetical protein